MNSTEETKPDDFKLFLIKHGLYETIKPDDEYYLDFVRRQAKQYNDAVAFMKENDLYHNYEECADLFIINFLN